MTSGWASGRTAEHAGAVDPTTRPTGPLDVDPTDPDLLRARFDELGVVVCRGLVDPGTLDGLARVVSHRLDALARGWLEDGLVGSAHADAPLASRYARLRAEHPARIPVAWRRALVSPEVHALWSHPGLVGAARALLGPDLWGHGIWNGRPREPNNRVQKVGWHQDVHYELAHDGDPTVVTAWFPLVPVDGGTGALQVLPGTHRGPVLPAGPSPDGGGVLLEVAPDDLPDVAPVTLDAAPGDVVLFHNRTVHRATPNRRDDFVRWSLDIRWARHSPALAATDPRGFRVGGPDGEGAEGFEAWAERHGYDDAGLLRDVLRLGDDLAAVGLDALARALGTHRSDLDVL